MSKRRIRPVEVPEKQRVQTKPQEIFQIYGKASLKETGRSGPELSGFRCVASWDVVHSPQALLAFSLKAADIGNVVRLYHGTKDRNVSAITQNGLRPGRLDGMFGAGIYLGGIHKALGYTNYGPVRYLFEVEAALGNVHVAEHAYKWKPRELQKRHLHSVHGVAGKTRTSSVGKLHQNEWCVYSTDQVKLLRLHEYHDIAEMEKAHSCTLVVQKDGVEIPRGASTFSEILSTQVCGGRAVIRCYTSQGEVMVCNSCLQKQKLQIGSKVTIRSNRYNQGLVQVRIDSYHSLY